MGQFIDLTGQRFGRWTVIDRAADHFTKSGRPIVMWLCRCDCGNKRPVDGLSLRSGKSVSCGCYRIENSRRMTTKRNEEKPPKYNGMYDKRLYGVWYNMKNRCSNPNHKSRKIYYDRGISVCEEWNGSYESFCKWAYSHGYNEHLTIDRIDNEKGYCPDNCRWVTSKAQGNNRRNNHLVEMFGEVHTLAEWSEKLGVSEYRMWYYSSKGFSDDRLREKLGVIDV